MPLHFQRRLWQQAIFWGTFPIQMPCLVKHQENCWPSRKREEEGGQVKEGETGWSGEEEEVIGWAGKGEKGSEKKGISGKKSKWWGQSKWPEQSERWGGRESKAAEESQTGRNETEEDCNDERGRKNGGRDNAGHLCRVVSSENA